MAERKPVDKRPIKDLLTEKDAFLTTSEKAFEYFLRHTKGIIAAVAAVALTIIGIAFYINYQDGAETKATEAFEAALEASAGETDAAAAISALETVRENHAGRKAARLAAFTLVPLYAERGEIDKALPLAENLLHTLTKAEVSLKPLLLSTLGGLYEAKPNYPLAARTYETLLAQSQLEPNLKLEVLIALGRVNAAAGQKDEAIKYYQTVLVEYPQSMKAFMVNAKLAELKGGPVAFPLPSAVISPTGAAEAAVPAAEAESGEEEAAPVVEEPAPAAE